jgi:1,4-dihydroxy-2-naphthoate octaprenyltransferase
VRHLPRLAWRLADRRHRPGLAGCRLGLHRRTGRSPTARSAKLFVFIFFGLVAVGGSYYLQTLTLTPLR